jgi:hypothetical protein
MALLENREFGHKSDRPVGVAALGWANNQEL